MLNGPACIALHCTALRCYGRFTLTYPSSVHSVELLGILSSLLFFRFLLRLSSAPLIPLLDASIHTQVFFSLVLNMLRGYTNQALLMVHPQFEASGGLLHDTWLILTIQNACHVEAQTIFFTDLSGYRPRSLLLKLPFTSCLPTIYSLGLLPTCESIQTACQNAAFNSHTQSAFCVFTR